MSVWLEEGVARIEELLREEARLVGEAIRDTTAAFLARDTAAADAVVAFDDEIDKRYLAVEEQVQAQVLQRVLTLGADEGLHEWGLRMIVVARSLERIGDHAVDIGEQTAYRVTGTFYEFTDASHPAIATALDA